MGLLDRGGLDKSPLDRSSRAIITLSGTGNVNISGKGDLFVGYVSLSGTGAIIISGYGHLPEVIKLSGTGALAITGTGHLSVGAILSGTGNVNVGGFGNLESYVVLSGTGNVNVGGFGNLFVYDTIVFAFAGTVAIGKTVCIDGRDFTVKKDGVNEIALFTGDFPIIFPDISNVKYTDALGSRTVLVTVTKKDRKV